MFRNKKCLKVTKKAIKGMILRWVDLTKEQTKYLAQLAFVDKQKANEEKEKLLQALQIEKNQKETHYGAWLRIMAAENNLKEEKLAMWLKERFQENYSLTQFIIILT